MIGKDSHIQPQVGVGWQDNRFGFTVTQGIAQRFAQRPQGVAQVGLEMGTNL